MAAAELRIPHIVFVGELVADPGTALGGPHRGIGVEAERVPMSGTARGSFSVDVIVAGKSEGRGQGRAGGQGFTTIERWLGKNDLLFLRRDRAEPLVVMPWRTYQRLNAPVR